MSRIAFDARLAGHPGIGRYIRSLLGAMIPQAAGYRWTLIGKEEELKPFAAHANVEIRKCAVPIYGLPEQMMMPRYFEGADLVHVPHFNAPAGGRTPLVVTIHDLIYFFVKDYWPFPGAEFFLRLQFRRLKQQASRIITVSQSTLTDLEKLVGPCPNARVIPEAADPLFYEGGASADARSRFDLERPYVLSVGSLREHKNIPALLAAFDAVKKRGIDADLVLVGGLDKRFDKKHGFLNRIRWRKDIRYLGKIADADLAGLYRSAACFVMPSFYEGFGLPVIEAMASGTPVISSNASSLPEVAGDAGLLFSPAQIDRLSELLYNVLSDSNLRKNLSAKGLARARLFSWEKTAAQTLSVYKEVLAS